MAKETFIFLLLVLLVLLLALDVEDGLSWPSELYRGLANDASPAPGPLGSDPGTLLFLSIGLTTDSVDDLAESDALATLVSLGVGLIGSDNLPFSSGV